MRVSSTECNYCVYDFCSLANTAKYTGDQGIWGCKVHFIHPGLSKGMRAGKKSCRNLWTKQGLACRRPPHHIPLLLSDLSQAALSCVGYMKEGKCQCRGQSTSPGLTLHQWLPNSMCPIKDAPDPMLLSCSWTAEPSPGWHVEDTGDTGIDLSGHGAASESAQEAQEKSCYP